MRKATLIVAVLVLACGGEEREAEPVTGRADLDKPAAGAPDAGTAAGHGNDGGVGVTGSATFAFTGRVSPAGSTLAVRGSGLRSAVVVEPSGRFSVAVDGLRPGPNALRVTAASEGRRPWTLDVRVVRGGAQRVEVPRRDPTPPIATLVAGDVVSVSPSARGDRGPALPLSRPAFRATAVARDDDGGTGRVRLSTSYVVRCGDRERRITRYLPPAQIANVALAPGALAPTERARTDTVALDIGRGCRAAGEVWAEATNANGLQAVTRHVRFSFP